MSALGLPDDGDRSAPPYPVESVDRTLQLVQLLADQREVKLSAVREQLDVGQSTAHRLLAMLVYRGFAVQDPRTRAYAAGPALLELGRHVLGRHDDARALVEGTRPVLLQLARETGETAHLAVLVGTVVRYLDVVETEAALRVGSRVGSTGPAHATSIGKAMLATLPDEDLRHRYRGGDLEQVTARTLRELDALLSELGRSRRRGWARNREETQAGVCSVGIGVRNPHHGMIAGLSIATPTARWTPATEREHARLLLAARDAFVAGLPRSS